jgi:hypothetical protein
MPILAGWDRAIRRAPMFRDRTNRIVTTVLGAGLAYLAFRFVGWAW